MAIGSVVGVVAPPRASTPRAPPEDSCVSKTGCDVGDLFRILGKTHMLDILWTFVRESPNARRFVEVQKELKLSPNTLSGRLKDLVDTGLLSRVVYNEIPPRVDYAATQKALDLGPIFSMLHDWARTHDLKPIAETVVAEPARA